MTTFKTAINLTALKIVGINKATKFEHNYKSKMIMTYNIIIMTDNIIIN